MWYSKLNDPASKRKKQKSQYIQNVQNGTDEAVWGRKRDTGVKNRHVDTEPMGRAAWIHITSVDEADSCRGCGRARLLHSGSVTTLGLAAGRRVS